jgi:hypothetical protein
MRLKHYLWPKASKMNIVPNLHSTLISVPKMADADYVAVSDKKDARIYDTTTTIISAIKDPILVAPHCQDTGLWKLDLDYEVLGCKYPDQFIAGVDKANTIFDQALPWFGQNAEGTHEKAAERSAVDKGISIGNNQGRTGNSKPTTADHQKALWHLCRGVQTVGHCPHRPNQHIPNHVTTRLLVHNGGHPSGHKLIFCKLMKNQTKGKMITAYQKMVNRMTLLALRLNITVWTTIVLQHSKHALQRTGWLMS